MVPVEIEVAGYSGISRSRIWNYWTHPVWPVSLYRETQNLVHGLGIMADGTRLVFL